MPISAHIVRRRCITSLPLPVSLHSLVVCGDVGASWCHMQSDAQPDEHPTADARGLPVHKQRAEQVIMPVLEQSCRYFELLQ
jgi:hypothetical protein